MCVFSAYPGGISFCPASLPSGCLAPPLCTTSVSGVRNKNIIFQYRNNDTSLCKFISIWIFVYFEIFAVYTFSTSPNSQAKPPICYPVVLSPLSHRNARELFCWKNDVVYTKNPNQLRYWIWWSYSSKNSF